MADQITGPKPADGLTWKLEGPALVGANVPGATRCV